MAATIARSSTDAREAARSLVLRYGWNASAYQILNPGMRLWFSAARNAVAGYAVHAQTWVVAGAPVCASEHLDSAASELEEAAARAGQGLIYFGAGERLEQRAAERGGHCRFLLGAQPVWSPATWPSIVKGKASLRAQLNRARNKGVVVTEWPAVAVAAERHPALKRVRDQWLGTRGLPPLHFMTETDTLGNLRDRRVFVAERDTEGVVAFLVATPVPARQGWLVEQWPRTARAPNGTTHLLVDAAMRALAASGADYVTLGLAPLSERAGAIAEGQPLWLRGILRWLRAHGRRFYNFRGLEAFKASLEPERWEPIYALAVGERFTVRSLRAVAGVFGGGAPERLLARALSMAAVRELARVRHVPRAQ